MNFHTHGLSKTRTSMFLKAMSKYDISFRRFFWLEIKFQILRLQKSQVNNLFLVNMIHKISLLQIYLNIEVYTKFPIYYRNAIRNCNLKGNQYRKIIVTGGAGFIAVQLLERYCKAQIMKF